MPTVMIVGASRGIGLELTRQYAEARWPRGRFYQRDGGLKLGMY